MVTAPMYYGLTMRTIVALTALLAAVFSVGAALADTAPLDPDEGVSPAAPGMMTLVVYVRGERLDTIAVRTCDYDIRIQEPRVGWMRRYWCGNLPGTDGAEITSGYTVDVPARVGWYQVWGWRVVGADWWTLMPHATAYRITAEDVRRGYLMTWASYTLPKT